MGDVPERDEAWVAAGLEAPAVTHSESHSRLEICLSLSGLFSLSFSCPLAC